MVDDRTAFIKKRMEEAKRGKAKPLQVEDFSSHLHSYHRSNSQLNEPLGAMELPGQYGSDQPPEPNSHVLLDCLDSDLLVMVSMRAPKRVTFHGSDQKDSRFLVKGGEDLRLDERVQLMFGVMNRALAANPQCRSRGLGMRTYKVK